VSGILSEITVSGDKRTYLIVGQATVRYWRLSPLPYRGDNVLDRVRSALRTHVLVRLVAVYRSRESR
jgi:hypothetical protein